MSPDGRVNCASASRKLQIALTQIGPERKSETLNWPAKFRACRPRTTREPVKPQNPKPDPLPPLPFASPESDDDDSVILTVFRDLVFPGGQVDVPFRYFGEHESREPLYNADCCFSFFRVLT